MSSTVDLSLKSSVPFSQRSSHVRKYASEHDAWQGVMAMGAATAVLLSVLPVLRFGSISGAWQAFVLSAIFSAVLGGLFLGALVSLLSGTCALLRRSRTWVPLTFALSGAAGIFAYVAWRAPLELARFAGLSALAVPQAPEALPSMALWLAIASLSTGAALVAFRLLRASVRAPLSARPLLVRGAFSALLLTGLLELLGSPGVAESAPLTRTGDLALLSGATAP